VKTVSRALVVLVLLAATCGAAPALPAPAVPAPAAPAAPGIDAVRLAPSRDGNLGAWLLLGPFRSATNGLKTRTQSAEALVRPPVGLDEAKLDPHAPAWIIASSAEGPVDVKAALAAKESDIVAYAAATLHLQRPGRHYLMLGADDGVRMSVDGKVVLVRDDARPERDDDDIVPIELAAGDHPIVLKLHQREGAWSFRLRVLDAELAPPAEAYLELPGTHEADSRALAAKMSWISVDRGLEPSGYAPKLTVRFAEGYPLGVHLPVRVRLTTPAATDPLYEIALGEVLRDRGELVATLPALRGDDLARIEDKTWAYEVDVADRKVTHAFYPRKSLREAMARLDRAIAALPASTASPPAWLARGSLESVLHLAERMTTFVAHGDVDLDAEKEEAKEIDQAAAAIEKQIDPYASRTGPVRRAYRSPVDDRLAEYGVYVPAGWKPGTTRRWPAVVMLHGLNGRPMSSLRHFFGGDDPKKEGYWEDRHALSPWPPLDAFVITPNGHGNTMYRQLGQDDILRVLDEVTAVYAIDRTKVTITGPSMGGIGSAALALRHPDRFAAAAPLCGYHSYFVRGDFIGRPIRPWERFLAEERSNVFWAWNGQALPLFIVHGTLDLPEANSGVLIEKYTSLKYSVEHEHPNLGHNVWQTTYEELRGAKWLLSKTRTLHPASIRYRTARLRERDVAWLHFDELAGPGVWGEVEGKIRSKTTIDLTTKGVTALHLDRDEELVDLDKPTTVTIDGTSIAFPKGEPIVLHRAGTAWVAGLAPHDSAFKHGDVTGPIRDAFHEPLLFVYGADDPTQTRANEEVARSWASMRGGIDVKYPVMSDTEFFAKNEPIANPRALFLVGNARSNKVVRALEPAFPIKIVGDALVIGAKRFTGAEVGAAFIRPNPKRLDRYVVVVEGLSALGTWRSLSLPDLLPDFVVFDGAIAPSRGQMILSAGSARAAGMFANDWSLPPSLDDPLAMTPRPAARTEPDATQHTP
jgi:predicted esterase